MTAAMELWDCFRPWWLHECCSLSFQRRVRCWRRYWRSGSGYHITHRVVLHLGDGAPELGGAVYHGADICLGGAEFWSSPPIVLRHEGRMAWRPLALLRRARPARSRGLRDSDRRPEQRQDQARLQGVHVCLCVWPRQYLQLAQMTKHISLSYVGDYCSRHFICKFLEHNGRLAPLLFSSFQWHFHHDGVILFLPNRRSLIRERKKGRGEELFMKG